MDWSAGCDCGNLYFYSHLGVLSLLMSYSSSPMVRWVGLQFVIVIFLDHTHLLSEGFSFLGLESKQIHIDSNLLLNISLSVSRK